jgi:hypothetical protein
MRRGSKRFLQSSYQLHRARRECDCMAIRGDEPSRERVVGLYTLCQLTHHFASPCFALSMLDMRDMRRGS